MWEVSTPFVYMRWFLFTLGKSQTKAYIINGLLMVFTFFVFRNIMGVGALRTPCCAHKLLDSIDCYKDWDSCATIYQVTEGCAGVSHL